jgi:serine/threonine protein kinase
VTPGGPVTPGQPFATPTAPPSDRFTADPVTPMGPSRRGPAPEAPRKRQRVGADAALREIQEASVDRISTRPRIERIDVPGGPVLAALDTPVGQGSFGRVRAAIAPDGRLFALKALRKLGLESPGGARAGMTLAEMRREAQMQVALDPEGAGDTLFRVGEEIYLMAPLRAGDLQEVYKRLDAAARLRLVDVVVTDALAALRHLHGQGLAHGDLKMDNLYLDWEGRLRLGDPGSVGAMVSSGKEETGDFNRSAPEQRADGVLSAGTDLWSLGLALWEWAGGVPNPLRGRVDDWCGWHVEAPRDAEGRITLASLDAAGDDSAWATQLRGLPRRLAEALANDFLHPDPQGRATLDALGERWPKPGNADRAPLVTASARLPAARARQTLVTWLGANGARLSDDDG